MPKTKNNSHSTCALPKLISRPEIKHSFAVPLNYAAVFKDKAYRGIHTHPKVITSAMKHDQELHLILELPKSWIHTFWRWNCLTDDEIASGACVRRCCENNTFKVAARHLQFSVRPVDRHGAMCSQKMVCVRCSTSWHCKLVQRRRWSLKDFPGSLSNGERLMVNESTHAHAPNQCTCNQKQIHRQNVLNSLILNAKPIWGAFRSSGCCSTRQRANQTGTHRPAAEPPWLLENQGNPNKNRGPLALPQRWGGADCA